MRWQQVLLIALVVYLLSRVFGHGISNITNRLPRHSQRRFPSRNLAQIEQIVVHHSGGPSEQSIEEIARYHIGPNHVCASGCPGILYHFAITRQGQAYQVNKLETIAWHLAGQNTKSVGVMLIGNYDEYPATAQQLKALRKVIRFIEKKVGRKLPLTDHGTQCNGCTDCPGDYLQEQIYA